MAPAAWSTAFALSASGRPLFGSLRRTHWAARVCVDDDMPCATVDRSWWWLVLVLLASLGCDPEGRGKVAQAATGSASGARVRVASVRQAGKQDRASIHR
jgi:hypothetical protein